MVRTVGPSLPWSLGVLSCPQLPRLKNSEPLLGISPHARPPPTQTAHAELTESALVDGSAMPQACCGDLPLIFLPESWSHREHVPVKHC